MTEKKAIIIIGPPGSGKGTQARILAERLGYFHFEVSKIVKGWLEQHKDDPLVKESLENYATGKLYVPEMTARAIADAVPPLLQQQSGIIFDGSPRTLGEAKLLWPFFQEVFGIKNINILYLNLGSSEAENRLKKRLVCPNGHSFIEGQDGLGSDSSCPEGDGVLAKRDLDDPEVMRVRFEAFQKDTVPAIEFLRQNHKIVEIDGSGPVEQVAAEIANNLGLKQ